MDLAIPKRSGLLAIVLSAAVVFMAVKTYLLWTEGPWDLPTTPQVVARATASEIVTPTTPLHLPAPRQAGTAAPELVIAKNLFDPERGAGQTKEKEANNLALQRIKGLILMGTLILGESRYAIVQDSGTQAASRPAQGQASQTLRFKTGDTFEGFSLSQIQDKNVVFTSGAARVELALDYFRKVEASAPSVPSAPRPQVAAAPIPGAAPGAVAPRVIPQLPRRERLPAPPSS